MNFEELEQSKQAWFKWFSNHRRNGHVFYLLTVTYLRDEYRTISPEDRNRNLNIFWTRTFLPRILGKRFSTTQANRDRQPKAVAFLDRHLDPHGRYSRNGIHSEHLHHHAIIAAPFSIAPQIDCYIGKKTFEPVHHYAYVESTDLQKIDATLLKGTFFYAAKSLRDYPDPSTFPDFSRRTASRKQRTSTESASVSKITQIRLPTLEQQT